MSRFVPGFLLGCLLLQQASSLPAWGWLVTLLLPGLYLLHFPRGRWVAGLPLGFAWAAAHALIWAPAEIPDLDPGRVYLAQGVVVDLPDQREARSRFVFRVAQLQGPDGVMRGDWRLRVSWYRAQGPEAGERWRLPLRIKPVRGVLNPGGWDQSQWLYRQGMVYSAWVARGEPQRLETQACCGLQRARALVRERIRALPAGEPRAILLALVLGDRSEMSPRLRQALSATGTSHLLAISGLHIGLSAGLFGWLGMALWRRIPGLCKRVPAPIAGAVSGLIAAALYSALSGFGLPAQRALVMLGVAVLLLLGRYRSTPYRALAAAALAVLLFSPMSVLAVGFWLSFTAVMAILVMLPQLRGLSLPLQLVGLQLGISLALYPVLLISGMPASGLSPLVNLLLVPLFSLLLVPAALLGCLLLVCQVDPGLLDPLLLSLQWVVEGLYQAAQWQPALPVPGWHPLRWLVLVLGVALLLPATPLRAVGLVLLLAAHAPGRPGIAEGNLRVTLLDVGQGLSLVLETRNHLLVYDTGPAYPSGFNLAQAAVLPYLRHLGRDRIDVLVLSHADNDHAGGAGRLHAAVPIGSTLAGESIPGLDDTRACRAGQEWQWDGVRFRVLWPRPGEGREGNNASCVLLVSNAAGSILLSGDIEAGAERAILDQLRALAPIDLVVASHHGSATSSTTGFIDAVDAEWVLYSAGYLNRYRFPRDDVVQRWREAGVRSAGTRKQGALRFELRAADGVVGPAGYLSSHRRYWHRIWQSRLRQPGNASE